jgi:hypothetical protein
MACASDGPPTQIDNIVNSVVVNLSRNLTVGQSVQADAVARSASGGELTGVTLTWSSSNPFVATVTQTGMVTAVAPGKADITASAADHTATVTVTVLAPPSKLAIVTQPGATAMSSAALSPQPAIELRDADDNAVPAANIDVTASLASGSGTLGGTLTATTNESGVATFSSLSIVGTGAFTLRFASADLPAVTSSTITVAAGVATQLSITQQPSATVSSGAAFPQQPKIQLLDASNNAVSQANVVVTAAIASGTGTLGGTLTARTNASGVATFTGLTISGLGAHTLRFSAPGLGQATSSAITVNPGAASKLTITTQPSSTVQNGVALAQNPVIQVRDAGNNAIAQAGVVVTAAIGSGGGALSGTTTATTDASGVATFTNLVITGTAGARTLSFSAPSLTSITSSSINVTAGAASQVVITTQPSTAALSGVAFTNQPAVRLRDASGNNVSQSGVTITASIASGTGTLGGTATASTNTSGVATFTNLSITSAAGAFTLRFSSGSLTAATSGTITISVPGTPTALSITTQPSSSASSGVAFGVQPVIQLRDASNNAVAQSGVVVTAAIATGGGTLGGTTTATTNASGVATFTNLSITGTDGARTISFTAPSLTSVTSNSISVSAGGGTGLYPNRPSNFTNSTEIDFSQTPPALPDNVDRPIAGTNWNMIFFGDDAGGSNWTNISDASAPQSAPGIWQGRWAAGSYGGGVIGAGSGHGIGNVFTYAASGTNRLYMSLRVYFDFDPSQWHPISNKFVNLEGDHSLILMQLMEGGNWRHAEELGASGFPSFWVDPSNSAGQVTDPAVPNRQWTQIELLIDIPNHIYKIWQDGVLTTNATPTFASTRINTVGIYAFRGGGGETLSTTLYYKYDHFFVAW